MNEQASLCPIAKLFKMVSGEWTLHIIWTLSTNGPIRYGELKRAVEGISSKVLTDRLKTLEAEGLVHRDVTPTNPPAVSYSLTEKGRALDTALRELELASQSIFADT